MANEVEIIVKSTDKSKAAIESAKKNVRELKAEAERAGKSAEGMGAEFADAGQKAADEAATATDRVQELDNATQEATQSAEELGDTSSKSSKKIVDGTEKAKKSTKELGDETAKTNKKIKDESDKSSKALSGMASEFSGAGKIMSETFGQNVVSSMAKVAPGITASVAAPLLPAVAVVGGAAAGALVLAFGAGLAGMGLAAGAQSIEVSNRFSKMTENLGRDAKELGKPFQQTWLDIADQAEETFAKFRPALANSFRDLAPAVSEFTGDLASGLQELEPAVGPLTDAFTVLLDDVGARLPDFFGGISDSLIKLADSIEKNPRALGDFVEFMGNSIEFVMDELRGLNDLWAEVTTDFGEEFGTLLDFDNNVAPKIREIADSLGITATSADVAKRSSQELESALDDIASSASDVTSRADGMIIVLDKIAGRTPSYQEATQTINDSIRSLGDTFGDVKNHVDGYGEALLNADGTVNTATENGSKLFDTMTTLQSGFADAAASTRELEKAGYSHADAVNKVSEDLNTQRQRLIDTAGQMGFTKGQMEKLLATYGLTPETLRTLIQADDTDFKNKVAAATASATKTIYVAYQDQINYGGGYHSGRGYSTGIAHGGIVGGAADGGIKPGLKWVGEQGPELVKLPAGSQVIPSNTSRNMVEQSRDMFQGYKDSYDWGQIPEDLWERLKSQGWKGDPTDGAERIYKPSTSGGQGSSIGGGGRTVLEIRSGGSRLDDLLVELLRKAVQQQGGDVQTVLGGDRW